jgi:hypothetical protein
MAHTDETFGLDDFGAIDPDDAAPSPRRRMWPVGGALGAAALAGALLVWQPWAGDNASTPVTSEPRLPAELVLDMPGLTLSSSWSAVNGRLPELSRDGFIFAAPDATINGGPLLAFIVDDTPEDLGSGDAGTTVDINGATATIEDLGNAIELRWEGEPGVRYGVSGSGVPQSQVIAFASAVSYENGITTVDDPEALAGLEPAGELQTLFTLFGLAQPMFFGSDSDAVTVTYDVQNGGTVALASMPAPAEFVRLARLLLDDEAVLEVDGDTVIIGQVTSDFGAETEQRLLLCKRGGRLISILGSDDADRLLALLATVRAATSDEWAAVLAAAEDDPFNFGGNVVGATVAATDVSANTEP